MTQYTEDKRDRAVLVGLSAHSLPREECATEASMEELEALLETAGGVCVGMALQTRDAPDRWQRAPLSEKARPPR